MPDSFFQSDKKRKRSRPGPSRPKGPSDRSSKPAPRSKPRDEDLSSDEEGREGPIDLDTMDFRAGREDVPMGDEEYVDENETAGEKRVRLAKGYLARVRDEVEAGESAGWTEMRGHADGNPGVQRRPMRTTMRRRLIAS